MARAVEQVERLHEIVRGYPGSCTLQILFTLADGNSAPSSVRSCA